MFLVFVRLVILKSLDRPRVASDCRRRVSLLDSSMNILKFYRLLIRLYAHKLVDRRFSLQIKERDPVANWVFKRPTLNNRLDRSTTCIQKASKASIATHIADNCENLQFRICPEETNSRPLEQHGAYFCYRFMFLGKVVACCLGVDKVLVQLPLVGNILAHAARQKAKKLLVVASPKTSRDIRETSDYSASLESKIKIFVEVAL